jgi:hypothetical protein
MSKLILNKWYYDEENDQRFELIDLKDDYVVVQSLDGSIHEYSIEEWDDYNFEIVSAPKSWNLSWGLDEEENEELEDRYETVKRAPRLQKKEESVEDEIDELTFPEDFDDSQDFDNR